METRAHVGGFRRMATLGVALLVGVSAVFPAAAAAAAVAAAGFAEPPGWVEELTGGGGEGPEPVPWEEAESAPLLESEGVPPLEAPVFPEPGRWTVPLVAEGEVAGGAGAQGPVAVGSDAAVGEELQVDVLDRAVAERLGVTGFMFGVSDSAASGGVQVLGEAAGAEGLPAELAIDFSGFESAYGASFANRLQVVAMPRCVLEDPIPEGCNRTGVELPTRVDLTVDELVVEVEDLAALAAEGVETGPRGELGLSEEELAGIDPGRLDESVVEAAGEDEYLEAPEAAGGPDGLAGAEAGDAGAATAPDDGGSGAAGSDEPAVVFAVTSSASGGPGDYGATPLGLSGDWQVAPGTGEFSYSYGMDVPAAASGAAPEVGLGYSSGAVDGLVSGANTQSPQNGVGWGDFAGAFIERRYEPCTETIGTEDLCWSRHNATMSFNGLAGRLIPEEGSTTEWRAQGDPGWRIQRLSGGSNEDNNGEYWKVTTTDGTQYWFGLGQTPESVATESVYTVPTLADHSGEPCRGPGDTVGGCDQAWRWNLDRVVDPNGNLVSYRYYREWNRYAAVGGLGGDDLYVRAGRLLEIDYGAHTSGGQRTARVSFGAQYRCNSLDSSCAQPNSSSSQSVYPDVPLDLLCSSNCLVTQPTFFSTKRYSHVKTEVRVGSDWRGVDQYNMAHSFIGNADGDLKLYLTGLQQVGLTGSGLAVHPPLTFWHFELDNRVDVNPSAGETAMGHFRVGLIINEFGGETLVDYGQNRPCTASYAVHWDENVRDCFPGGPGSYIGSPNTDDGLFNKWLVEEVVEEPKHGSPSITTTYTYEGDPAWHFQYDPFMAHNAFGQTVYGNWTGWRGYGTVSVTQGNSTTRTRLYRGMDGDWTLGYYSPGDWHFPVADPPRDEDVETFDGSETFTDSPALAGRVLEEQALGTLDGVADVPLESTLYEYEQEVTAVVTDGEAALDDATWSEVSSVTSSVATSPTSSRQSRAQFGYNEHFQQVSSLEEGWLDETGDERCALTTYAENASAWMFSYPASITTVAGDCSSTDELSVSETYYDDSTTLGDLPGPGMATRTRAKLDASSWTETTTTYDTLGRTVSVTDANGATTTTGFTASPAHAIPTETTVTNDLGHTSTTEWRPELGAPVRDEDANGNVTTYGYDGWGRLIAVRLPTEQPNASGKPPSIRYTYLLDPNRADPPVIRTRQLVSEATEGPDVVLQDSWVLYDGLARERQTQSQSPEAGKVIASTTSYDGRGLTRDVTGSQAITGTPGGDILGASWENRTRTLYDELGRPTTQQWWRGTSVEHETTYAYTEDTTTTTPPVGGQAREVTDGLGRTVSAEEHDGSDWQATSYTYDLADQLTSVTDPAGNTIDYTYNMAGWKLTTDDPDRGTASLGYDAAGQVTSVTDGNGDQIHTLYDPLGRPTERRADSPTGDLLASWAYDAPGETGLLDAVTRHDDTGDWVSDVTGYDGRNRTTGATLTVPAGIPGLSGSYTTAQTYDAADRTTSVTYPAVGGLPQETVTTDYDSLGLPVGLSGDEEYVSAFTYDDRGRPDAAAYGPQAGGQTWMAQDWSYDADQRPATTETWAATATTSNGVVARHEFGYDDVGNITDRATSLNGQAWRECYSYDDRHRLVDAHTVDETDDCDTGTPGDGDQPYEHTYTYSPDGNITQRVEDSTTTNYTYPSSGDPRPHAPTDVDGDTYSWDANGNLTQRVVDGDTETFTWDIEQRLATVDSPDGETSFVYDTGGQRLLRQTNDGVTLYAAGHEIHANADGSTVTAVRSYTFGGSLVATRTPDGVSYLGGDQAGSTQLQVASEDDVTATRTYTPYGAVRSETGDLDTDRGFLGQIEDPTGLSYLNARYYDTHNALFISPDPIIGPNPYGYANGNPTNLSDPSGLWPLPPIPIWTPSPSDITDLVCFAICRVSRHVVSSGSSGKVSWAPMAQPAKPVLVPYPGGGGSGGGGRSGGGGSGGGGWSGGGGSGGGGRSGGGAGGRGGGPVCWCHSSWGPAAQQAATLRGMGQANPDPGFWRALDAAGSGRGLALAGLRAANPDPGFWRALNNAGSGRNLALSALRNANNDPGFWRFLNAAGSASNARSIADWAESGRRGNAISASYASSSGSSGGGSGGGGGGGSWDGEDACSSLCQVGHGLSIAADAISDGVELVGRCARNLGTCVDNITLALTPLIIGGFALQAAWGGSAACALGGPIGCVAGTPLLAASFGIGWSAKRSADELWFGDNMDEIYGEL